MELSCRPVSDDQSAVRRTALLLNGLHLPSSRGHPEASGHTGIGITTAATMSAELVDIRRFSREDSLACYSATQGLG